jgi:hypothetical protein
MSRNQTSFLIKQTFNAVLLNALFSAIAMLLVFGRAPMVPLSGLIADSILQTFIATFMSTLPPSLITSKWMLTRPELRIARTPAAGIWIRSFLTALAAAFASSLVLPFAMPRLFAASLPFGNTLLLKCLYGMAVGLAATPFAVAAVLRGPRPGERTDSVLKF